MAVRKEKLIFICSMKAWGATLDPKGTSGVSTPTSTMTPNVSLLTMIYEDQIPGRSQYCVYQGARPHS